MIDSSQGIFTNDIISGSNFCTADLDPDSCCVYGFYATEGWVSYSMIIRSPIFLHKHNYQTTVIIFI